MMNLSFQPKTERRIRQRLDSGQYDSAEHLLEAGLAALEQQETFGDFEPGEMDRLIDESLERSKTEPGLPAAEVFAELRRMGANPGRGNRP
jgi:Arc/MetJ-type ribon-helix-helix transcriptional regulator